MPTTPVTTTVAEDISMVEVASAVLSEPLAGCWDKSDSWKAVRDRIRAISALGPDWDGMGGAVPSSALVVRLVHYVRTLYDHDQPAPSRIAPTALGTIVLEWHSPGVYIEAEIVSADRLEIMEAREGEPIQHSVLNY